MAYLLAVGVLLIIITLYYFKNYLRCLHFALKLKGPPCTPILGNVLLLKDGQRMAYLGTNASQLYGTMMASWISVVPFIWIYEPRHLKIILSTNKYSEKNIIYRFMHNFVGDGLITNNGYKWKKNRKLIQPYFLINSLEKYIAIFSKNAQNFVGELKGHTIVNITSFVNDCILGILHNAVLGVPVEYDSPYRQGEVLLNERLMKPWLLLESIFKHTNYARKEVRQRLSLHTYTEQIVMKRKEELRDRSLSVCLLDILIDLAENNSNFTNQDIIDEAVTFMLAGQDSVGATVAFTLLFLAKYKSIQEKVVEEMREANMNSSMPSMDDLNSLKYLEQVIKESMRLAPSVPMIARILTKDVTLDDVTIPKGMNLVISPFITHRLPHVFSDPMKFDPDRFSQDNLKKQHPLAFVPFSAGPRNCLGYKFALLEIKTILSTLLNKYQFSTIPGHEEIQFSVRATLRAKGGIKLHLNRRE